MLSILAGRRLQKLLDKNQIQILHYIPGRIRLKSPYWLNSPVVSRLVAELELEPDILSISYTPEIGTLLVCFNDALQQDYARLEVWLKKLDSVTFS